MVNELKKQILEEEQKAAQTPAYDMSDPFVVEILDLIEQRKAAKKNKDFAEADRIRQYLADKGVTLIDDRTGTTFKIG